MRLLGDTELDLSASARVVALRSALECHPVEKQKVATPFRVSQDTWLSGPAHVVTNAQVNGLPPPPPGAQVKGRLSLANAGLLEI